MPVISCSAPATIDEVIMRADDSMYAAKSRGNGEIDFSVYE